MKSFEEHLRGAKAHNREDKIWLVTCFSGKMAKLCAKYGFPDDEDMFVYLIEHFLRDLDRFVIYASLTSGTIYLNILNFLTRIKVTTKALKKWQQG